MEMTWGVTVYYVRFIQDLIMASLLLIVLFTHKKIPFSKVSMIKLELWKNINKERITRSMIHKNHNSS